VMRVCDRMNFKCETLGLLSMSYCELNLCPLERPVEAGLKPRDVVFALDDLLGTRKCVAL